jgi:hypothetical protein
MKLNKVIKTMLTFVLFLMVSNAFSQAPTDPDEDLDDEGADLNPAPIGDYILPMLVLGIATAYVLLRKKTAASTS